MIIELSYVDDNQALNRETFDMVVLAVGLTVSQQSGELAAKMGVTVGESGFCETSSFTPVQTDRPGILVAGMFQAPKDIPQTVMEASAAAGCIVSYPRFRVEFDDCRS